MVLEWQLPTWELFLQVEVLPFNSTSLCHLIPFGLTVLIFLKLSAQNNFPPCGRCCTLHWTYTMKSRIKLFIFLLHFFIKQVQYMRFVLYKSWSEL